MLAFCYAKDMAGPALHPLGRSPRDPPALARSRLRSRPSGHRRERRTEGLRPSEPPPKGANSPLLKPAIRLPSSVTDIFGRSSQRCLIRIRSRNPLEDLGKERVDGAVRHRWRHLFLARSATPKWRGFTPPNHPTKGALRPFRNPQVSDLSFVICHIIFRT